MYTNLGYVTTADGKNAPTAEEFLQSGPMGRTVAAHGQSALALFGEPGYVLAMVSGDKAGITAVEKVSGRAKEGWFKPEHVFVMVRYPESPGTSLADATAPNPNAF